MTYKFLEGQENGFLEGKKSFLVPQKNYRSSKQPIDKIIGIPTFADAKAMRVCF